VLTCLLCERARFDGLGIAPRGTGGMQCNRCCCSEEDALPPAPTDCTRRHGRLDCPVSFGSAHPRCPPAAAVGRSVAAGAGGERRSLEMEGEARGGGLRQAVHRSGPDSIEGRDLDELSTLALTIRSHRSDLVREVPRRPSKSLIDKVGRVIGNCFGNLSGQIDDCALGKFESPSPRPER
jgi:hypothetical protein